MISLTCLVSETHQRSDPGNDPVSCTGQDFFFSSKTVLQRDTFYMYTFQSLHFIIFNWVKKLNQYHFYLYQSNFFFFRLFSVTSENVLWVQNQACSVFVLQKCFYKSAYWTHYDLVSWWCYSLKGIRIYPLGKIHFYIRFIAIHAKLLISFRLD